MGDLGVVIPQTGNGFGPSGFGGIGPGSFGGTGFCGVEDGPGSSGGAGIGDVGFGFSSGPPMNLSFRNATGAGMGLRRINRDPPVRATVEVLYRHIGSHELYKGTVG